MTENYLPENDRSAFRLYPCYTITNDMETSAEGQTFLVVKLKREHHVVQTKQKAGIMTELQDWKELCTSNGIHPESGQLVTRKGDN